MSISCEISNNTNYLDGHLIPFFKMHGCGNDFVLIDNECLLKKENVNISVLGKNICNRNFGIGADGMILFMPSEKADFRMRIINSDGSEAEMCGNGIRCFTHYIELKGRMTKKTIEVETLAGIIKPTLITSESDEAKIMVNMGTPKLKPKEIPISGFKGKSVVNKELKVDDRTFNITTVSMGNPHCVIFLDDLDNFDFKYWGEKIENHSTFPNKTNVEFAKVDDKGNVTVKVWERGCGATLACGTGACATLVAGVLNNLIDKKANIHLPGGTLEIEWNDNNELIMTGSSMIVFTGVFGI